MSARTALDAPPSPPSRVPARMRGWPHVVVVGGGFGGLTLAKALGGRRARVTVVDRENHHLFQPLLYQVATAGLSPAEIAAPIRSILHDHENVSVLLAEVTSVDLPSKRLVLADGTLDYDYLVLAVGAVTHYFGHDAWREHAPGLKNLEDAVEIRRRVLLAFERAERETDEAKKRELLTFVVIGGGPTGVELAGAIEELSRFVLAKDFRSVDPKRTRVVLVEAGDRVLAGMDPSLSAKAKKQLEDLGVEVRTGRRVTTIDAHGVDLEGERIAAGTVIWGAGVRANPLLATLVPLGVALDGQGRVVVKNDCSIPSWPRVFVIGDAAAFTDDSGHTLPGLSPVAMQQGRAVAESIFASEDGRSRRPFRYRDKGTMATVGRSRAVAQTGSFRMSGFLAWLAWLVVHVWYLIGFRSRIVVLLTWAWSYVTYKRGARLITASSAPTEPRGPRLIVATNTASDTKTDSGT